MIPRLASVVALIAGAGLLLGGQPRTIAAQAPPPAPLRPEDRTARGLVDKPYEREYWFYEQRALPARTIPPGARARGLDQARAYMAQQAAAGAPVRPNALIQEWTSIGPTPLNNNGTNYGGRVKTIAVAPGYPNTWLIGAADGGIWKTVDGGATWSPRTDDAATLAMGAIAYAPSNGDIVYAGTGEISINSDSYFGAGLLKSTDGGETWSLLAASDFAGKRFATLIVHPTLFNTVLGATSSGVYKSVDGGLTWSLNRTGRATDLVHDPLNFDNQYTAIGNDFGGATNGLYRSTNAGDTWTNVVGPWTGLSGGVGRIALALAPSAGGTLYVAIADAINSTANDNRLLGLWRTDNAWDTTPTWVSIPLTGTTNNICGTQCWYDLVLSVDPTVSDTLYVGGINLWRCLSCDATPTWANVGIMPPVHVDQHALTWSGNRLIAGNDGGVFSTITSGASWSNHNSHFGTLQFYYGAAHPSAGSNLLLGGMQDNGNGRYTGAVGWTLTGPEADGAAVAISRSNPATHWAVSNQLLTVYRTINGGTTYDRVDEPITDTYFPFISNFKMCPHNHNVVIAGTDELWKTTNFYSSHPADPTWTTNGPQLAANRAVNGIAFAPGDTSCGTYVYGNADGTMRITTNGGGTWTNLDPANQVPNRFVKSFAFDPFNADVLYVTLSGFDASTPGAPGHVFKSTNARSGAASWTNITPGGVDLPINVIAISPHDHQTMYLGGDIGVWKSVDGGATWALMGPASGIPNAAVNDLVWSDNKLFAFTHGRGAYVCTACGPATAAPGLLRVTTTPAVPALIYINGVPSDYWGLTWLELAPGPYTISFSKVQGFAQPAPREITVAPGQTTLVDGEFTPWGYIRVQTSPALPAKITIDGNPINDWGAWPDFAPGPHQVCGGAVPGYVTPACQNVNVTAGQTTNVTLTYTPGGPRPPLGAAPPADDPAAKLDSEDAPTR